MSQPRHSHNKTSTAVVGFYIKIRDKGFWIKVFWHWLLLDPQFFYLKFLCDLNIFVTSISFPDPANRHNFLPFFWGGGQGALKSSGGILTCVFCDLCCALFCIFCFLPKSIHVVCSVMCCLFCFLLCVMFCFVFCCFCCVLFFLV